MQMLSAVHSTHNNAACREVPRNSSWIKRCLRLFQHINGADSRAGLLGNVLLGTCFYSFDALDTVNASGNTADAGWGWMPDHAINATSCG